MIRNSRSLVSSLVIGLAWMTVGCGGASKSSTPDSPMDGIILNEVGEAYRFHSALKGKPPEKFADIEKMEGISPSGVQALKKGDVIVQWGVKLPDLGEEPGKVPAPEILAYQKQVPEQGGYVLQLDRTIRKMTVDEFKAAPKAVKN